MLIGEPSYTTSVMPTMSAYGNMMQIDNVFAGPVPLSDLSGRYDSKLYTSIARKILRFPSLSGDDTYKLIRNGTFDHVPSTEEIVSTFFSRENMENKYAMMISSCPINGDEASLYLSSLMSGIHLDTYDPERIYMATIGLRDTDIYTVAVYGRFDENGNPIYPSSPIHMVYRTMQPWTVIDDYWGEIDTGQFGPISSRWEEWQDDGIPQMYGEFYTDVQAQNTYLTGYVHVGSPRRMPYQVPREGDYKEYYAPGGEAGYYLNVYRNSLVSSMPFDYTGITDWNIKDSRIRWANILCNLNIGNCTCWDFTTRRQWFQHPDKVLNYGGHHDWNVEAAHFTGGNIDWMLDFRTDEELSTSFLGAQIDGIQYGIEHNNDAFYAKALFRNGEFFCGKWVLDGTTTSGMI